MGTKQHPAKYVDGAIALAMMMVILCMAVWLSINQMDSGSVCAATVTLQPCPAPGIPPPVPPIR